ncbi:MAG: aldehyde dehydrogenase family protein [Mycobacteriales bacterium]
MTAVSAQPALIESRSPVTGQSVGTAPVHDADNVRAIVAEARKAQESWGALAVKERSRHLRQVQRNLAAAGQEIAEAVAEETGKSVVDGWLEVLAAVGMMRWVSSHAPRALRPQRVNTAPMVLKQAAVHYSPYGVVGVISPWNYPAAIPFQSIPWILACGNTVVLKPSELSTVTAQRLADAVNSAGLPLIHLVTGYGETGAALVRGGVDKLVFTGSGPTGRRIAAAAAETLTPVVMELGGKDALIVCGDADVRRAAGAAVAAGFHNAGQTCMAPERAIVVDSAYDAFLAAVRDEVAQLKVGPGAEDQVGALTQPGQALVVQRRVDEAIAAGARVVAQATAPGTPFFAPLVLADVPRDSELWTHESFAPVLSVTRVRNEEEALRVANDSDLGLNGSVFTGSRKQGKRMALGLVTGGVNVNDALVGAGIPALPFGGEKGSGYGRLQGRRGFEEFSRSTSIVTDRFPGAPSLATKMLAGKRPSVRVLSGIARYGMGGRKASPR